MKEEMEVYINARFKEEDWTLDDVSNYGIARSGGGIFTITVWRNIKGAKDGPARSFKIKLDGNSESLFLAVETLEHIMKTHATVTTWQSRLKKKEEQPDNPFI